MKINRPVHKLNSPSANSPAACSPGCSSKKELESYRSSRGQGPDPDDAFAVILAGGTVMGSAFAGFSAGAYLSGVLPGIGGAVSGAAIGGALGAFLNLKIGESITERSALIKSPGTSGQILVAAGAITGALAGGLIGPNLNQDQIQILTAGTGMFLAGSAAAGAVYEIASQVNGDF